ncbi:Coenzyme F420 hydrogenase/dehydrogenase, beta subunit C-terminal domain [Phocaeicola sp.]
MKRTIQYTIDNNLCTGCGICEDICPTKSIQIAQVDGEYRPYINKESCLSPKCNRCLKACPGIGIDLKALSNSLWKKDKITQDNYIGYYLSLYTGYSNNKDIRFHSASGGMVTQFLIFLLEKKVIDGAVVTTFSNKNHITPAPYIAKTKEEILAARSSKYCPVTLNKVGNEIAQSEGKFVIVGLPCHIQGFRKRAQIDRKFREQVIGYFTIYCSSNRTFNAQDFLLKKYHYPKQDIKYFAYRDNGCLGNMVLKTDFKRKEIPFTHYYGCLRSFFKPRRCLTCIDHYGELADVCFGDIHIKPYSDDKVGISSCIVRNNFFDDLLKQAKNEGYLTLETVDAFTLNESQKVMLYPKKRKAKALMNIDKTLGRKSVVYDISFDDIKPTIKDYISVITTNIQRFIGRHRSLWFIIDFLYDRK